MSPFRYHDEESTATGALYVALGALAGFAAGVVVAQHYGGLSGLTDRIRQGLGRSQNGAAGEEHDEFDQDEDDADEYDDHERPLDPTEELEERVLEAFRNDPILSERAIDIGALDEGIVELTGWVNAAHEADQAVVITRGVPGVDTVVNRLAVRTEEDLLDDMAGEYDDESPDGHWEGQNVGTGRRRQGNSTELDRHADPHVELEEKAMDAATLDADDEDEIKGERRRRAKKASKAGRGDGSAISPSGVPNSDHVVTPPLADIQ